MDATATLPKIIWSYWDNPDTIPEAVELCKKSWRKLNPEYTIHFLHRSNYAEYVNIPAEIANHRAFNDMPQRFADLLRMYVLVQHGGVWCDSSILMSQGLDSWLIPQAGKEVYGFTIEFGNHPGRKPVLENWFLAAPPNSPFMRAWLAEFLRLRDFASAKEYVADLVSRGLDNRDWCCPDYLAMHHSAYKLIQLDEYDISKFQLWPSEKGPYKYLVDNGWNAEAGVRAACKDTGLRHPFMKMRVGERGVLEKGLHGEFSNKICKWI